MNVQPKYRSDIDGLRAIAVLAVIGFHAFPNAISGGFVGVDVFFVISGFLISTIVFTTLEQGSFSFIDFYARRIKRIFPALILVLAASWIAGWCFLYPLEYENLSRHVAGGAGFLSNFILWRDSGYFDAEAELKPLLHLWSLGIEEQFYLVWPITLVLAWRLPRIRLAAIAGLALCSFALSVWATDRHPVEAYYFPVTRFWELMVGCLFAYASVVRARPVDGAVAHVMRRPRSAMLRWLALPDLRSVAGLALIAAAAFGLDRSSGFPGWLALLPTLGTFLLISAGPRAWINRRVLGTRLIAFVGLISYPLYLWHWPLLSFARIIEGGPPPRPVVFSAVALSFLLAWLTYEFIEKRIKRGSRDFAAVALGCVMVGCLAIGIAATRSAIRGRLDTPLTRSLAKAESDWVYPSADGRLLVGEGDPDVLFIGDSHMEQYFPRVRRLVDTKAASPSQFLTRGGCPPLPNVNLLTGRGPSCEAFFANAIAFAFNDSRIKTVVIGGAWENYFLGSRNSKTDPLLYAAGDPDRQPITIDSPQAELVFARLAETMKALRAAGKKVFVLLNNPTGREYSPSRRYPDRITMAMPRFDTFIKRRDLEAFAEQVTQRVGAAARQAGALVINPLDFLCDSSQCPTVSPDGAPLYKDTNHLRAGFARESATYIDEVYFQAAPDTSTIPGLHLREERPGSMGDRGHGF